VLAIPEGAIVYNEGQVHGGGDPDPTLEAGKRRVVVATGISNGSKIQIVKGLAEGQQVILQ